MTASGSNVPKRSTDATLTGCGKEGHAEHVHAPRTILVLGPTVEDQTDDRTDTLAVVDGRLPVGGDRFLAVDFDTKLGDISGLGEKVVDLCVP